MRIFSLCVIEVDIFCPFVLSRSHHFGDTPLCSLSDDYVNGSQLFSTSVVYVGYLVIFMSPTEHVSSCMLFGKIYLWYTVTSAYFIIWLTFTYLWQHLLFVIIAC